MVHQYLEYSYFEIMILQVPYIKINKMKLISDFHVHVLACIYFELKNILYKPIAGQFYFVWYKEIVQNTYGVCFDIVS